MKPVAVDVQLWPIVVIHVRDGANVGDFDAFIADYGRLVYERQSRFVGVTDLTGLTRPPGAKERARLAEWMNETKPLMERYGQASTNVLESALARGALTALYWLSRPPVPQATHASLYEALIWARDLAREKGLGEPADIEAWFAAYASNA